MHHAHDRQPNCVDHVRPAARAKAEVACDPLDRRHKHREWAACVYENFWSYLSDVPNADCVFEERLHHLDAGAASDQH